MSGGESDGLVEILALSDTHVGRRTVSYNVDRFREKMREYTARVVLARRALSSLAGEPDKTVLMLLGDIVDGEEIYRGQGYEQDLDIHEQIDVAAESIKQLVDVLGVSEVAAVSGNHGVSNRRGKGNWDYTLYEILKGRLFPHTRVYASREGKMTVEYGGVKWLLWHPYEVRMYMNIPFYGLTRQGVIEALLRGIDAAVAGHFHSLFYLNVHGVHIYGNGSFLEGDEFSRRRGWVCDSRFWYLAARKGEIVYQHPIDTGCRESWG